jgi:hypothetical protein
MTKEELLKELKRLADWYSTDASYRPPEDPMFSYSLGSRDALKRVIKLIEDNGKVGQDGKGL